jgi:hypothetical protein
MSFRRHFWLVSLFLIPAWEGPAHAQSAGPQKIPTSLGCWQVSSEGKRVPTFADKFTLNFSNGALAGERPTRAQKGSDRYTGNVEPDGKIKVSSKGRFDDRSSEWTADFAGRLQEKGPTVLNGSMRVSGKTPAVHKCAIAFLVAPPELAKIFSAKEAVAQPKPQ